jgi:hypothetical protein
MRHVGAQCRPSMLTDVGAVGSEDAKMMVASLTPRRGSKDGSANWCLWLLFGCREQDVGEKGLLWVNSALVV